MILDMCKPEVPLSIQDRIAVILLDIGGAMSRDSLLTLLSDIVRRSRFDEVLGQMREHRLIDTAFTQGHKAIYFLTLDGATYSKKLVGIRNKVRYGQSAIAYARTVEALLMRFVKAWGLYSWQYHAAYEAYDELAFLRERRGVSVAEIKRTTPSPSALIRTPSDVTCFVSIDNHSSAKNVYDETRRYMLSLNHLDKDVRRVLFVTTGTAERAQWIRARAMVDSGVKIGFCTSDQAVEVLEGSVAPIR